MKCLRLSGLLPLLVVSGLIYIGSVYYLDVYLQRLICQQGSKLNGALVEIDSLQLSFRRSRLQIRGLRLTDPKALKQNRVDIGNITADFQFLPLLKKKFVIDQVAVTDWRWATPRQRPGVIPAAWQRQWQREAAEDTWTSRAVNKLSQQVVAELPRVDIDKLVARFDPREFVKLETLPTYQQAKAMPDEVTQFFKTWQGKSQQLVAGQEAQLKSYRDKIVALDPRQIKNVADVLRTIETVQSLQQQIQSHKTALNQSLQEAKSAVAEQVSKVSQLRQQLDRDIEALKNKLGFGELNIKEISQSIFGPALIARYQQFLTYYDKANRLLAAMKNKEQAKIVRQQGRNVHYPITDKTPKFLLTKAELSTDSRDNATVDKAWRGYFQAQLQNLTSQPKLLGKPMQMEINAKMQDAGFASAHLAATLDRTREVDHDLFQANVAGIRLSNVVLGPEKFFQIPIASGSVDLQAKLQLEGEQLTARVSSDLQQLKYNFKHETQMPPLVEIIQEVIITLRQFDVEAMLSGALDAPQLKVRSSFDEALVSGVKRVLLGKLNQAKAKLEAYLRQEIGSRIATAEKLVESKKGEVVGLLQQQLNAVGELEKLAKSRLEALKQQQETLLKQQLQNNLPPLKLPKFGK